MNQNNATPLILVVLVLGGLCGCAHLATVKTKRARVPANLAAKGPLESAKEYLNPAEREPALPALGHDLLAAKISNDVLGRRPEDESARNIYNFAVARSVQNIKRASLQPWQHPSSIATDEGDFVLSCPKPVDTEHDPSRYDLFPSDTLSIGGKFLRTRSTVDGIGAPLVAVGRTENPHFRERYTLRRVYASVTAIIKFSGQRAKLEFIDPLATERFSLGGNVTPLAADFTASTPLKPLASAPDARAAALPASKTGSRGAHPRDSSCPADAIVRTRPRFEG